MITNTQRLWACLLGGWAELAALTSIAIGTAITGGVVAAAGAVKANADAAEAARKNAEWMREQAKFQERATERELEVLAQQADQVRQRATARGGLVGGTGSALSMLADLKMQELEEGAVILEQGEFRRREALMRAGASEDQARRLSSGWTQGLAAAGPLLTAGSSALAIHAGSKK